MHEIKVQGFAKFENAFVAVKLTEHDAREAGIGHQFEATEARRSGNVNATRLNANTGARGLNDGVGFSVHRSHTMAVLHEVAGLVTVR